MIVELYHGPHYHQIWDREGKVYQYEGRIGERGTQLEADIIPGETIRQTIDRLTGMACFKGFAALPPERLTPVVITFSAEGWDAEDIMEFDQMMRDLLGSALGWTGNGFYDGYALGHQRIECWCMVINVDRAIEALMETLQRHRCLHDPELQTEVSVRIGDHFRLLYPPSGDCEHDHEPNP